MSARLRLRPAQEEDRDLIFAWANDPQTRAASFQRDPIDHATHCAWFVASLERADRRLFVLMVGDANAALLRLDLGAPGEATVSINLAPDWRGQGLGAPALALLEAEARGLGARRLIAYIRAENAASLRAFARAGYHPARQEPVQGQDAWRYERPL